MDIWLLASLIQRLELQIQQLRTEIQRLAVLAVLWSCVVLATYHSTTAQQLLAESLKSYLTARSR